jgi:hypothetical protein
VSASQWKSASSCRGADGEGEEEYAERADALSGKSQPGEPEEPEEPERPVETSPEGVGGALTAGRAAPIPLG